MSDQGGGEVEGPAKAVLELGMVQPFTPLGRECPASFLFEDAVELLAAGPHVVDVGAGGFVAVFEGAFFLGFAPADFVVAVGVFY